MSEINPTKLDVFLAKVEQRKACEKKAFETSMILIDPDKVNDETLINTAIFIDQERYRGVNEDRALKQICGYPICSNQLAKDIPKNQYFINVKVNKVIDTSERRLFCSIFCYKASKYFERQIPTSPVWARDQQDIRLLKIELLSHETVNESTQDKSTIISHSKYMRSIPQNSDHRRSSSSSSSSDDEFEQLQLARDEYYKSRSARLPKLNFVEQKLQQIALPEHIRTENTTIDFVISCLYEWMTEKSRMFIQNYTITSSINSQRYQELVHRLDAEEMMSGEAPRAEKKLPTVNQLRTDQQYELKVKEFLFGKEETATAETPTIILPPVDAYSQQTIRLSIVTEKVLTCFKQIFTDNLGEIRLGDLRSTLSELLLTFNFTSENITLKPNEWTIMTLLLLYLLTIKLPVLSSHLTSSRIIHSLLENLNLSSDTIVHIVKYLLDHPLDMILTQRSGQSAFKDLLESETIDIEKLKQSVQKNSIIAELKPLYWKILLGIKSPYRDTRQYVDQANCDIYQRLHSTLKTCRIIENTTPIAQQFLSMYLLDSHVVKLPITSTKEYESFLSIANFICTFLDNDNAQRLDTNAECWLMTCRIYDKFLQLTRRISLLRYHVAKIAQQAFIQEQKLLLHLNTHNIFTYIPENWLKDGFQLITDDMYLLNIWEKFLAGSEYIFVFLTIHILHHCRVKLLGLYSTKEIMQYLLDLKIGDPNDCEHIVIASIASWKKQGGSALDFPAIHL